MSFDRYIDNVAASRAYEHPRDAGQPGIVDRSMRSATVTEISDDLVVHAGIEQYPVSAQTTAIGLPGLAAVLRGLSR